MLISTTLVIEGYYENGFITNEKGIVIAKVKNRLYSNTVGSMFILIEQIYDQERPIKDDSFEIMSSMIDLINSMLVFLE